MCLQSYTAIHASSSHLGRGDGGRLVPQAEAVQLDLCHPLGLVLLQEARQPFLPNVAQHNGHVGPDLACTHGRHVTDWQKGILAVLLALSTYSI